MYCIYCRYNEAIYGTYCRNCGKLQQRGPNSGALFCAYCRADNPGDALFCWNCGNQFQREADRSTSDRIISPGMPLPGPFISGSQSLGSSVPLVQGTPQASSVPLVQGTPSPLSNPLINPGISQGAALSSPPDIAPPHEYPQPPTNHPGQPPIHHPGQPPIYHPEPPPTHHPHPGQPPVHHPEPPPIHHPGQPPVHHPEPWPVHRTGEPSHEHHHHHHPTHQHLEQVSTPQTTTIARRAARGGARAAGGLSRRAVLALLVGGVATVAVGATAAAVILTSSSPDKTVLAFCNALKNGDSQTAYNQLSSQEQSQMDNQQFVNFVQDLSEFKGVTDCSTSNVQQNGSSATVTLRVTSFGFFPTVYTVTLVKENGVWKIDDLKFLGL